MSKTITATRKRKARMTPKPGGRGSLHKNEPRDKVVRIRTKLFKEMSGSRLARGFNVDFDDITSQLWDFWKRHPELHEEILKEGEEAGGEEEKEMK
jgi:hypothetical protein